MHSTNGLTYNFNHRLQGIIKALYFKPAECFTLSLSKLKIKFEERLLSCEMETIFPDNGDQ